MCDNYCRGQCDRVKVSGLTSPNHNNLFNTFKILEEIAHPSFRDDWNTEEGENGIDNRYDMMLVRIESAEGIDAINIPVNTTIALNQKNQIEELSFFQKLEQFPRVGRVEL